MALIPQNCWANMMMAEARTARKFRFHSLGHADDGACATDTSKCIEMEEILAEQRSRNRLAKDRGARLTVRDGVDTAELLGKHDDGRGANGAQDFLLTL
jgi:hypothetical protein